MRFAVIAAALFFAACAETPHQLSQEGLHVEIVSKKAPRLAALCAVRVSERLTLASFVSQIRETETAGDYETVVRYTLEPLPFAVIAAVAIAGGTRIRVTTQSLPKHIVDELVEGIREKCG